MKLIDAFFKDSQETKGHSEWKVFNSVRDDVVDFYETVPPSEPYDRAGEGEKVAHPSKLVLQALY